MKCRIIKRTGFKGRVEFVIQQKHSLFRWWWVDASLNSDGAYCQDSFDTLKEARVYLWLFDGSKPTEEVVYEQNNLGKRKTK